MKTWKKILIIVGVVVGLGAILGFTIVQSRRNVVEVQTGKAARRDLAAVVTASGEIKPKNWFNVGANAMGRITKLYVKEGDRVKRGAMLAQIDNIQAGADVAAMKAALDAARTDTAAAEAALKTAQANLNRANADAERARLDYQRGEGLFKAALIAKQDYDARKAAAESADATVAQCQAQLAQAKAQMDSYNRRVAQSSATLRRVNDVLDKTEYRAPFDGTITNLPVREGETVVMGIQNSPGSTLMTLADMSTVTAEVRVDETDIVNVKLGQPAEVTIDAMPKKSFKAVVTEIGENALLRSTGIASSQSTSGTQEARDFKVIVTLQDPPENLRPGLSCTAKITTASRQSVVSIPIQALTMRDKKDLEKATDAKAVPAKKDDKKAEPGKPGEKDKTELQGVFVVRSQKAQFVSIETGVAGTTDIEVTSGLKDGDEIVTGSYKVLRTLKNGASVKINNSAPAKQEEKS